MAELEKTVKLFSDDIFVFISEVKVLNRHC